MHILYGNVVLNLFTCIILCYAVFFLLSTIVFSGIRNQNGKLISRQMDIIHVWHVLCSVAQNNSNK